MKWVGSTIFLLIFTSSIVVRTMERTEVWAVEHVHKLKHSELKGTPESTTETHKQNPRQKQTKLFEDGSVVHVSFVRSFDMPPSAGVMLHGLTGFVPDPGGLALSSRAPPALFS